MNFKLIIYAFLLVFVCKGGTISPTSVPVLAKIENFDPAPQYSFAYDVQDPTTGDSKAQYETRNGDIVQGSYSLIEADGTRRIVDYIADPVNGFNAVVNREPAVAVVTSNTRTLPIVQKAVPVSTKSAAPVLPIFLRAVVSSPIVDRRILSPISLTTDPVASGRVIQALSGFPRVADISDPISDNKISTLAAPLTFAAAGYAI